MGGQSVTVDHRIVAGKLNALTDNALDELCSEYAVDCGCIEFTHEPRCDLTLQFEEKQVELSDVPARNVEMFRSIDTDNSFSISKAEYTSVLLALNSAPTQTDVDVSFKMLDTNDDGELDFSEFNANVVSTQAVQSAPDAESRFHLPRGATSSAGLGLAVALSLLGGVLLAFVSNFLWQRRKAQLALSNHSGTGARRPVATGATTTVKSRVRAFEQA
ncbi:MAG: hypothetical protein MHM6MM_004368 [Cercozoa sp. M6MM]